METEINDAIKALAEKTKADQPNGALHLSQAALNLAHVLQVKKQIEVPHEPEWPSYVAAALGMQEPQG